MERTHRNPSLPARGAWIEIVALYRQRAERQSLPARGAWIEIRRPPRPPRNVWHRSPHGERGLKLLTHFSILYNVMSLPVRGAWIEIPGYSKNLSCLIASLPARGAWIEISAGFPPASAPCRRSPHGERGLKSQCKQEVCSIVVSLRACAAWVETRYTIKTGIPPNSCTAGNVKVPCEPRLSAPTATRG